jgi:hypothetical protein
MYDLNGFILQNLVFIWSFELKNATSKIFFVVPFECDLNVAVSIFIV